MTETARTLAAVVADLAVANVVARNMPSTDYPAWLAAHKRVDALHEELWTVAERPATLPLRIAGETREIAVRWSGGKAWSVSEVGLARVRPGAKLWPMRAVFFMDDVGAISAGQTAHRVLGNAVTFCAWADAKIAEPALSASLHANTATGEETRAKASATRKAKRGGR